MLPFKQKLNKSNRIVWLFVKIFIQETPKFYFILSIVIFCIFFVSFNKLSCKFLLEEIIDNEANRNYNICKLFCYELVLSIIQELKYLLFLRIYGEHIQNVCVKGLTRIMTQQQLVGSDYDNGILQTNFQIGCVGLAKLLSLLVLNLLPGLIGVFNIFKQSFKRFDVLFVILIVYCFLVFIILNLCMIPVEVDYKRRANDCSGLEKRALYETLQNYENIKTSCTMKYEVRKYADNIGRYRKELVYYKSVGHVIKVANRFLISLFKLLIFLFYACYPHKINNKWRVLRVLITTFETESNNFRNFYAKKCKHMADSIQISKYFIDLGNVQILNEVYLLEFQKEIKFKEVTVMIDDNSIIDNFSATVAKGEKIALIGNNGTGKSTLFKALMRLNTFRGEIRVDECILSNDTVMLNNKIIGYVPQNIVLFNESILYNILYGAENKNIKDVEDICKRIDIHTNIKKKVDGYDTMINENGKSISGGERQKILLARILLRNPEILVLDEPFSQLDRNSKNNLYKWIFEEMETTTCLMILHDTNDFKHFDKFWHFSKGKIMIYDDYRKAQEVMNKI